MPVTWPDTGAADPKTAALPKYVQVMVLIRRQIGDGTLRPGEPVPSGAALSRVTGFSTLTCRKALRVLIADGVLVPGPSRNARPRVTAPGQTPGERGIADAARALSRALADRRRAAGLTQPELAARADVSVTTVGHAETGRLWQSRLFWTRADQALRADGDLLRLHDAYRAAAAPQATRETSGQAAAAIRRDWPASAATAAIAGPVGPVGPADSAPEAVCGPVSGLTPAAVSQGTPARSAAGSARGAVGPSCVLIVWTDGTVTTVRPEAPADPADPAGPPGNAR